MFGEGDVTVFFQFCPYFCLGELLPMWQIIVCSTSLHVEFPCLEFQRIHILYNSFLMSFSQIAILTLLFSFAISFYIFPSFKLYLWSLIHV